VQPTVIVGQPVAVHVAVSTLSYSRRFHFWGTDSEDAEHTYEALIRAFEWFGGAPAEVLVEVRRFESTVLTDHLNVFQCALKLYVWQREASGHEAGDAPLGH